MDIIGDVLIALLAFAGFLIASYIRSTKRNATPLVCPLEGNCEQVIYSKHSKMFGIPLETLGIFYYAIISASYIFFIIFPNFEWPMVPYLLLCVSAIGFFFSVYLTAIQALVLKHWCTWCLFSAAICTVIFIIGIITMNQEIITILQNF